MSYTPQDQGRAKKTAGEQSYQGIGCIDYGQAEDGPSCSYDTSNDTEQLGHDYTRDWVTTTSSQSDQSIRRLRDYDIAFAPLFSFVNVRSY